LVKPVALYTLKRVLGGISPRASAQ
jgi:hypothetical protein